MHIEVLETLRQQIESTLNLNMPLMDEGDDYYLPYFEPCPDIMLWLFKKQWEETWPQFANRNIDAGDVVIFNRANDNSGVNPFIIRANDPLYLTKIKEAFDFCVKGHK